MNNVCQREVSRFVRFLKDWTLLVCMAVGALGYYLLRLTPALAPLRHPANVISARLLPVMIFVMLFITFIKIDVRSYRLRPWHAVLLVFQIGLAGLLAWCVAVHPGAGWLSGAEGAFCCVACPTATAASVVVRKLGGNVPTITTYILLSSFVSAVALPLFLPLMEHDSHLRFLSLCLLILRRVTPTLIAPFLLATLIRWAWPRLGRRLADVTRDAAFYLWGFTLTILMAQTIHSVYGSHVGGTHVLLAAGVGLAAASLLFFAGRRAGLWFGDVVSCTQGLGQKNTSIAVWVCLSYLSPLAAVVPGSYIVWQNVFNSWQLWRRAHVAPTSAH